MPSKKFHIRCDMEGVTGVVNLDQVTPNAPEYNLTCEWFMAELVALVEGLIEGGASDVSIYDEHWFGRNVDLSRIPSGVSVFCGKPPYRSDWAGGLDASHTGLILHGLHSMAGTGHVLAHTYEPDFRSISINGKQVGEIGVETAIAGDWGVPLALIIADSAGVEEASHLVPGVATVSTKISRAAFGAECHPLADNVAKIRAAAAKIASEPPRTQLYRPGSPVQLDLTFNDGPYLNALRQRIEKHFISKSTLRLTAPTTTTAWADYWQFKLATQADLAA